ncbi:MAG: N-acetylmuramoyl-L-alanine amidase [Methyloceanibacter sp.]|uniref:N-acetylmuramoyl-L-alanine amidase n=1 Tax=Methyloceanibacter sp. TaxID=1965321 RepID=UPI001DC21CE9|nr:N-acetylmuramoyl-L-alanine amidase [Methyloceanibacter sp.]MCB1443217.1 N-acetylmuramoyl-L-alanine amidase [Methyloceanibacter sp.]MCC0058478.1 N-acetylmuramoyl-L-alanine amidase [Hyphomicrobiaceae bacterium]
MTAAPDSKLAAHWVPSPNFEPRRDGRVPDTLILHYTGMESCEAARDWLVNVESKVSAHYLVDFAGVITQMVGEAERAWHAGQSFWSGETDLNSASIGIEIHNPGHDFDYPPFPDEQMRAVEALCLDIFSRHAIPRERVLAHSDIAPGRKRDPGERFDWARLARAGIGLWTEPVPLGEDAGLGLGDESEAVAELQRDLKDFGYGVEVTSTYARGTETVVEAFQRHYRQARIDGRADRSTRETLKRLLAIRSGALV